MPYNFFFFPNKNLKWYNQLYLFSNPHESCPKNKHWNVQVYLYHHFFFFFLQPSICQAQILWWLSPTSTWKIHKVRVPWDLPCGMASTVHPSACFLPVLTSMKPIRKTWPFYTKHFWSRTLLVLSFCLTTRWIHQYREFGHLFWMVFWKRRIG